MIDLSKSGQEFSVVFHADGDFVSQTFSDGSESPNQKKYRWTQQAYRGDEYFDRLPFHERLKLTEQDAKSQRESMI